MVIPYLVHRLVSHLFALNPGYLWTILLKKLELEQLPKLRLFRIRIHWKNPSKKAKKEKKKGQKKRANRKLQAAKKKAFKKKKVEEVSSSSEDDDMPELADSSGDENDAECPYCSGTELFQKIQEEKNGLSVKFVLNGLMRIVEKWHRIIFCVLYVKICKTL